MRGSFKERKMSASWLGLLNEETAREESVERSTIISPSRTTELSEQAAAAFKQNYSNWLSVFELDGPDGIWQTSILYLRRRGFGTDLEAAVRSGKEKVFVQAVYHGLEKCFADLWKRHALDHLQRLSGDDIPQVARNEFSKLLRAVDGVPATVKQATPQDSREASIVRCSSDYLTLSADEFKRRWVKGSPANREIFDAASLRPGFGQVRSKSPDRSSPAREERNRQ
jgi:hypothetical protein